MVPSSQSAGVTLRENIYGENSTTKLGLVTKV